MGLAELRLTHPKLAGRGAGWAMMPTGTMHYFDTDGNSLCGAERRENTVIQDREWPPTCPDCLKPYNAVFFPAQAQAGAAGSEGQGEEEGA